MAALRANHPELLEAIKGLKKKTTAASAEHALLQAVVNIVEDDKSAISTKLQDKIDEVTNLIDGAAGKARESEAAVKATLSLSLNIASERALAARKKYNGRTVVGATGRRYQLTLSLFGRRLDLTQRRHFQRNVSF